jgi:transposase-like protein
MAYVIVTVSFQCPFCNRTSVEHIIAETERFDREEMARVLSRQPFECQLCMRTFADGTPANAHAELATPDRLKELGFLSSRIN